MIPTVANNIPTYDYDHFNYYIVEGKENAPIESQLTLYILFTRPLLEGVDIPFSCAIWIIKEEWHDVVYSDNVNDDVFNYTLPLLPPAILDCAFVNEGISYMARRIASSYFLFTIPHDLDTYEMDHLIYHILSLKLAPFVRK